MVELGRWERQKISEKSMLFKADVEMWDALDMAAHERRLNKATFVRMILAEWLMNNGYMGGDKGAVQE